MFSSGMKRAALAVLVAGLSVPAMAGDNTWSRIGPAAVSFVDVRWAPSDSNVVWAHSGALVYRSSDGGVTWSMIGGLPDSASISEISVKPDDATIVYVTDSSNMLNIMTASGDVSEVGYDTANTRGVEIAAEGSRIYVGTQDLNPTVVVSNDNGASWTKATVGSSDMSVQDIAVSPATDNVAWTSIWADGVYYTTDGGTNWTKGAGLPLTSFAVAAHPTNASIAVAATYSGVYKTTDGGANWSASNTGISGQPVDISFASSDGLTLYAATDTGTVYKSIDGGANWTQQDNGINAAGLDLVAAENLTGKVISVAWKGSFRSEDGGANWIAIDDIRGVIANGFVQDPQDASKLYLSEFEAGVYGSTDGGTNWVLIRDGLSVYSPVYGYIAHELEFHEATSTLRLGSTALHDFDASTSSWNGPVLGSDGKTIETFAVDPTDASHVIAESWFESKVYLTFNGSTWSEVTEFDGDFIGDIEFAPSNGNVVYVGSLFRGLWKSTDGGANWTQLLDANSAGQVYDVLVSTHDEDVVYIVSEGIMRSTDAGATWETLNTIAANTIAMSPTQPDVLVLGTNVDGVHRSVDGGETWARMTEGYDRNWASASSVAFDVADPTRVLATLGHHGLSAYHIKPDVGVDTVSSTVTVEEGVAATINFTVDNFADQAATGVVVEISAQDGMTLDSSDPRCSLNGTDIVCELGGLLEGDIITVSGTSGTAGTYAVSASVTSVETDPDANNNTTEASVTVEEPAPPAEGGGGGGGGTPGLPLLLLLLGFLGRSFRGKG